MWVPLVKNKTKQQRKKQMKFFLSSCSMSQELDSVTSENILFVSTIQRVHLLGYTLLVS